MLIHLVIMEIFENETFKKLAEGPIAAFKQMEDAEKCIDHWRKYGQKHEIPGTRTNYKVTTMYLQ